MIEADKRLPAPSAPGKGATYRPSLLEFAECKSVRPWVSGLAAALAGQPIPADAPAAAAWWLGWYCGREICEGRAAS